MKIYTRTGDTGTTSLIGGKRVEKNSPRLEAYGTVDELNSCIGLLAADPAIASHLATLETLHIVQSRLFDVGAYLATDNSASPDMQPAGLASSDITAIEEQIDLMTTQLPKLTSFVLPGGCAAAAKAHLCRTVCRRAERRVLTLAGKAAVASEVTTYLNRLSDYFFTLARFANHLTSTPETPWIPVKR